MRILPKQHSEVNTPADPRCIVVGRKGLEDVGSDLDAAHHDLGHIVYRLGLDDKALDMICDAYDEVTKMVDEIDAREKRANRRR